MILLPSFQYVTIFAICAQSTCKDSFMTWAHVHLLSTFKGNAHLPGFRGNVRKLSLSTCQPYNITYLGGSAAQDHVILHFRIWIAYAHHWQSAPAVIRRTKWKLICRYHILHVRRYPPIIKQIARTAIYVIKADRRFVSREGMDAAFLQSRDNGWCLPLGTGSAHSSLFDRSWC